MISLALFFCSHCGAQFSKWSGRCTECGAWGSVAEESDTKHRTRDRSDSKPGKIETFAAMTEGGHKGPPLQMTGLSAFDRLLSGGLVSGSVTLLGGEPGIGKSTIVAQLALSIAKDQTKKILYVTGEESPQQILLRLKRLTDRIPDTLHFLNDTDADVIAATIEKEKPNLTIIDSIQTLRLADVPGTAGNPSQVKAGTAVITETAKRAHAPVILIGQVTKDGDIAGPKLVEHLVDTVMMLEGDRDHAFRILRVLKHRFGADDEVAVLTMTERGLEEVADPSAALLADRPELASGSVVTCFMNGSRPMLVEIQALVTPAGYGTPFRRSTGFDTNRLNLLLAVMARRAGMNFCDQDVFVNVVGGLDAREPAADLAVCLALASAKLDRALPPRSAAFGEVGLSGEIRPVPRAAIRVKEAKRMGYDRVIEPSSSRTLSETLRLSL